MSIRMPKQLEAFIQNTLHSMRDVFKRDDTRCHYCGSLVDITTNQRDAYVIICPECGALGTSSNNPALAYITLQERGTIITRQMREAISHGQRPTPTSIGS